jgi:hypothetical protein
MFFSEPLLESIFGAQSADLCSKSRFLEPFWISRGPENDPRGDHFEPKGLQMASTFYRPLRLGADPAFHETTVITVPLGLTSFQNVFFLYFLENFLFFLFSVVQFFMTFLSLVFNKTPIIAQPLSPPFFGKNRVIFQKTHIFQLFIFASSFFRFFCFFMLFGMCFK